MPTVKAHKRASNPCGRRRPVGNPYEIWEGNGFRYMVLKKNQTPAREATNPYASWFCAVSSPFTMGGHDMGDTYCADILRTCIRTYVDPAIEA